MKKLFRFGASALGILLATGLLARWWLLHPEVIPRLPSKFWIWLGNVYGVESGEDFADLELAVALVIVFVAVLMVAVLGGALFRKARERFRVRSQS